MNWRHKKGFLQLFRQTNLEGKTFSRRYVLFSFFFAIFFLKFSPWPSFHFFCFLNIVHMVVLKGYRKKHVKLLSALKEAQRIFFCDLLFLQTIHFIFLFPLLFSATFQSLLLPPFPFSSSSSSCFFLQPSSFFLFFISCVLVLWLQKKRPLGFSWH